MTDDGGQRAERNQKSEIRRQREESWRLEERFARGWRQTKDNCGLRKWREREEVKLSVGGWRQKEESSKPVFFN